MNFSFLINLCSSNRSLRFCALTLVGALFYFGGIFMPIRRSSTVQERLHEALAFRNMRQIELSRATGIPRDSISLYTRGAAMPSLERINLMSVALGVSEIWLLGYNVPMLDP